MNDYAAECFEKRGGGLSNNRPGVRGYSHIRSRNAGGGFLTFVKKCDRVGGLFWSVMSHFLATQDLAHLA